MWHRFTAKTLKNKVKGISLKLESDDKIQRKDKSQIDEDK